MQAAQLEFDPTLNGRVDQTPVGLKACHVTPLQTVLSAECILRILELLATRTRFCR